MNLQQLEYIIAVDEHRHFGKAAEKTCVTQPTLSMMIQKLEDELGVKIFDRSKQPVTPTREGHEILVRARLILSDIARLKEYTSSLKSEIAGDLKVAVIPTLAPYLLPLFLKSFIEKYPLLKLSVKELTTSVIIESLKTGEIDIGLMATPLGEPKLKEHVVFHEEFFAYSSMEEKIRKKYIMPKDIDLKRLWILEEGHCFRNQVFNLCELKKKDFDHDHFHYETGSIETLKNLVDHHKGITILPYLATLDLTGAQKKKVRVFSDPKPVREISLVVNANFPRTNVLIALKNEIERHLPRELKTGGKKQVIKI